MLADYEQLVADLVRDDAGKLTLAEKDRKIQLAVERYSKDREREKVEDLTPTDANTLPLPAAWEADFSRLSSLEYPIGENPPEYIEPERYATYQSPSATVIKLIDAVAVAAANVRATYTIRHVVSAAVDSIPVGDREPVACYAGAICCDELAAYYSGGTDSTIQADSVEQNSKAREYAARARALRKRYFDELGIDDKRNDAAGVVVNLNQSDSRGQDRLTHGKAYR